MPHLGASTAPACRRNSDSTNGMTYADRRRRHSPRVFRKDPHSVLKRHRRDPPAREAKLSLPVAAGPISICAMRTIESRSSRISAGCAALVIGCAVGPLLARPLDRPGVVPSNVEGQPPAQGTQPGRGGGGGRGGAGAAIFLASDANKDGAVTRDEFKGAFD